MELRKWACEVDVDYIASIPSIANYSSFDEVGCATSHINLLSASKSISLEQVLGYLHFSRNRLLNLIFRVTNF